MPAIGPLLALGSLGVVGLLFATKTSKAGPAAPGVEPVSPGQPGSTVKPELQDIPLPLLQEMAKAMELLTVGPDGKIAGPVTENAIRVATALAAKLEAAGFHQAAKTIRDFATEAAKKIPSPPKDKQIPLPAQCFTPAEQEQVTRLATLERDPKVIRGVISAMRARAVPAECKVQVELAITTLEAVAVQMEARLAEEEALRRVEEELRKKSQTQPSSPGLPPFVDPVNPPPAPTPPSPGTPPPPPGSNPRVTIVQKNDGLIKIMRRLLGSTVPESTWRQLRDRNVPKDADGRTRAKDTDAKGGIKPPLQPGQKLFVPEQWPMMPSIPVPGPATPAPAPVPVPTPTGSGRRITIVQAGDGFSRIAQRLGNASLMTKLRDANVPVDAAGKKRAKADMATKGGITPHLNPGDKLFVPPEFPPSSFAVVQGVPLVGLSVGLSDETVETSVQSPVEKTAEEVVTHLLRLQARHPMQFSKIRHKMDKRKIARFEKEVGLNVTATVSPALLLKAAELGQTNLPLVIDWPENVSVEHVLSYRKVLFAIAQREKELGNDKAVYELTESIKRECGQAANLSVETAE